MTPATDRPTKTALVYLRVSSAGQANTDYDREGFSLPAQREACARKAETLDAMVVDEFVDRGETGTNARRAGLKGLLARVAGGGIDYVIVHKLDRLAAADWSIPATADAAGSTSTSSASAASTTAANSPTTASKQSRSPSRTTTPP